jgi:hypothetical protein
VQEVKAKRALTPGAVDPLATREAVCVKGYATARRPTIWQALKLKGQAMKLYGLPLTPANWHSHTLDHLIPLELGGMPLTLDNAWPQSKVNAKRKDVDENAKQRAVCAGTTTLAMAQQFFVNNWSV